ncbi:MAG: MATE family efflux transporter [Bacillota bacterium]
MRQLDRTKHLGEAPIPGLLIKFSLPAIVGMVVNALYNVVDRIFIGHGVGDIGIAGITVGFPMSIIMMAFGMLIGIGATSLISIRIGEQKHEEAEAIMANGTLLLILSSLGITVVSLIWLEPLMVLFGANAEIMPYALDYMKIIVSGSLLMGIGFGMNNFIRAEGNPKIAMYTMLIGAAVNTILDPIFIFGFGWGMKGAAWATVIAQGVSSVWVLSYFLTGKSSLKLRLKNFPLRRKYVSSILAVGSAPFLMQMAASLLTVILNKNLLFYGGEKAISVFGIINSLDMLIFMPIFGINQGSQPIIGYNYGAKNFKRVRHTLGLASLAATMIMLIGFVLNVFFPAEMLALFNANDPDLLAIGIKARRISALAFPIIGFQITGAHYFQAVGKPRPAMTLSVVRQIVLLIPFVIFFPRFLGLHGIFWAFPVSDLGAAFLTSCWLAYELRGIKEKETRCCKEEPAWGEC